MITNLKSVLKILKYNLKTLFMFEVFYRALGVLIIFPLVRLLFFGSIRLAGYQYITNQMILEYLSRGSTVIILGFLVILFSIYIVVEMIFLSIIYDYGYHQETLEFKKLLIIGFKQVLTLIKRYHIIIISFALIMFFVFEAIHIAGFASTISIPRMIVQELEFLIAMRIAFFGIVVLILLLFIETMFYLKFFTLESLPIKDIWYHHRKMLKNNRIRYLIRFIGFNLGINLILYFLYTIILMIIVLFIYITQGQAFILATIMTILYSFYLIATTLSTLVLIPLNYALISTWYYDFRPNKTLAFKFHFYRKKALKEHKPFAFTKPLALVGFIVLVGLNITNVISIVNQPIIPVEFLKNARVIAHRGASFDAPENTLSAIEIAIEQGADGVEFDVLMTEDFVPILMHDNTLGRTTDDDSNSRVDSVSIEYIKTLDAGSWFSEEFVGEPVPTLREALELIDGRAVSYIDLKAHGELFNQQVVDLITELGVENKAVVMSFNYNQLKAIKSLNPNIQTLLLVSTFFGDIEGLINDPVVDSFAFRTFVLINNPNYIRQVQQKGKHVYVWTLDTEEVHQQFIEKDVDGLITKDAVLARELVYSRNTQTLFNELLKQLFPR